SPAGARTASRIIRSLPERAPHPREERAVLGRIAQVVLAERAGELLEQFALLGRELSRHDDIHHDLLVPARAPAKRRHPPPAAGPGVALAGHSDPLLVGDPGRHAHRQLPAHRLAPAPPALAARRLGDAAIAATAVAHGLPHELSEGGAGDRPQLARPPAAR